MASHDGPDFRPPLDLLTLEGLNFVVAALLMVGTRRLGPEYGREVLALADELMAERQGDQ